MTKPTKPAGFALSNPVPQTKWEAQRQAERISLSEHKTVPHRNSTVGGRYEGKELSYRGGSEKDDRLRQKAPPHGPAGWYPRAGPGAAF